MLKRNDVLMTIPFRIVSLQTSSNFSHTMLAAKWFDYIAWWVSMDFDKKRQQNQELVFHSLPAFTSSKSTMETPEQYVKSI